MTRNNDCENETGDDYEVGYGRPPAEHQFEKGQSGNPNGRPPKAENKSLSVIIEKVLMEKMKLEKNGKQISLPKIEVLLQQTLNEAIKKKDGKIFIHLMKMAKEIGILRDIAEDKLPNVTIVYFDKIRDIKEWQRRYKPKYDDRMGDRHSLNPPGRSNLENSRTG